MGRAGSKQASPPSRTPPDATARRARPAPQHSPCVCEESFIGAAAIRYSCPTSPASGQRSSAAVSRESKVSFTPIAAAMQNAGMLAIT